jgi:hypothetical protein
VTNELFLACYVSRLATSDDLSPSLCTQHFCPRAYVPMSIAGRGSILLLRPLRYTGRQYVMPLRAKIIDPQFASTRENVPPPHIGPFVFADFVDEYGESCAKDN